MATHTYEPEAEVLPRDGAGGVHVATVRGRTSALAGVRSSVPVLLRIRGPDGGAIQRQPLRVACVLDCSGSMMGEQLSFAKRAALKLVKHLGPGDTLHFVAYDTDVRTVFENGDLSEAGKESLRAQVEALKAGGQTNLFGGLERAVALLSGSTVGDAGLSQPEPEASALDESSAGEGVRRIFLFSDGYVNRGVTDPGQIRAAVARWARAGITTSSFGIGSSFDEALMQGIADEGKGQYFFLPTAHAIPRLVSKAVHGLLDLYASEAVLEIRGCSYTTVSRVYGSHDDDLDVSANADLASGASSNMPAAVGVLDLGDVRNGSELKALVDLDISLPGDVAAGVCFTAAEWTLTFQRINAPVQLSGKIEIASTHDRSLALRPEAPAVLASIAVHNAARLDEEVAQLLSTTGGRLQAKQTKAKQITLLQNALQALRRDVADPSDVLLLECMLERASRAQAQLEDDMEDEELVRRKCVQDSRRYKKGCGGSGSGCDSSGSGGDVANMDDVASGSGNDSDENSFACGMTDNDSEGGNDDNSSASGMNDNNSEGAVAMYTNMYEEDEEDEDEMDGTVGGYSRRLPISDAGWPSGPPASLKPILLFSGGACNLQDTPKPRANAFQASPCTRLKSCLKPQSRVQTCRA